MRSEYNNEDETKVTYPSLEKRTIRSKEKKMSKDGVKTLFNVAALATNVLSERGEGSLIEFASSTQNIILVTVEDTLTHHAVTPEILKFCTNIYIGYYLQAVALLNTIGDVSVRQVLDRLNTNRSVSSNAKDTVEWIAQESFLDYPKFNFAKKNRPSPAYSYIP